MSRAASDEASSSMCQDALEDIRGARRGRGRGGLGSSMIQELDSEKVAILSLVL